MGITQKIKVYKPSSRKITEETSEIKTYSKGFYSYLNTVTEDEIKDSKEDILCDYKINNVILKENPSDIKVDYKKSYYKIQLNKTDWDKIFEADNKPIDYDAIDKFLEDTNSFYE